MIRSIYPICKIFTSVFAVLCSIEGLYVVWLLIRGDKETFYKLYPIWRKLYWWSIPVFMIAIFVEIWFELR